MRLGKRECVRCKDNSLCRRTIFFFLKVLFPRCVFLSKKETYKHGININIFNCTISKIIVNNYFRLTKFRRFSISHFAAKETFLLVTLRVRNYKDRLPFAIC